MTFEEKLLMRDALRQLATTGTELNNAKRYAAFGILRGNDFRIAVSVSASGTSFYTENKTY